jgi:hypothetical protein
MRRAGGLWRTDVTCIQPQVRLAFTEVKASEAKFGAFALVWHLHVNWLERCFVEKQHMGGTP